MWTSADQYLENENNKYLEMEKLEKKLLESGNEEIIELLKYKNEEIKRAEKDAEFYKKWKEDIVLDDYKKRDEAIEFYNNLKPELKHNYAIRKLLSYLK